MGEIEGAGAGFGCLRVEQQSCISTCLIALTVQIKGSKKAERSQSVCAGNNGLKLSYRAFGFEVEFQSRGH